MAQEKTRRARFFTRQREDAVLYRDDDGDPAFTADPHATRVAAGLYAQRQRMGLGASLAPPHTVRQPLDIHKVAPVDETPQMFELPPEGSRFAATLLARDHLSAQGVPQQTTAVEPVQLEPLAHTHVLQRELIALESGGVLARLNTRLTARAAIDRATAVRNAGALVPGMLNEAGRGYAAYLSQQSNDARKNAERQATDEPEMQLPRPKKRRRGKRRGRRGGKMIGMKTDEEA